MYFSVLVKIFFDHAKKFATDAIKTPPKRVSNQ